MSELIIGILGGGKWGTSLAEKLSQDHQVKLYCRDLTTDYKKQGVLEYFRNMEELKESDLLMIAVPSFAVREVAEKFHPFYSGQPIIGVSKGVEKETGLLPSQIIQAVWGETKYAHLSGPSFATEVSQGLPAILSLALADLNHQKYFQNIINLKDLKIQLTEDLIGVQLAGALKNIIAIAGGINDAFNYGENSRVMLILQGLQEMVSLGKKLGAKEETFFGPSGLGDLILTATSRQSRNYRLGIQLVENSQNKTSEIIEKDTFEGVSTAAGAYLLARKFNLRLPIIEGVYRVIYENENPKEFLKEIQENGQITS